MRSFSLVALVGLIVAACQPTPASPPADTARGVPVGSVAAARYKPTRVDTVLVPGPTVYDTLYVPHIVPGPTVYDTIRVPGSTKYDTTVVVRVDSVSVPVPGLVKYDTVLVVRTDTLQAPPPPGEYAGILCDSMVVVHRTAAGAYYTIHTMATTIPGVPDTVTIAPTLLNATLNRPSSWVAVVVQGPNPERMQVAYFPGDTEVLKNACYNGPVTSFTWVAVSH